AQHFDAFFIVNLAQFFRDIGVFAGYQPLLQKLHDGHFGTNGVVKIGELHADSARAHHHHSFRLFFERHGFAVFDNFLSVYFQVGQFFGATAGSDDDVLGAVFGLFARGVGHFHFFAAQQLPVAFYHGDFVFTQQELYAFAHAVGHFAAAFYHAVKIGFGGAHADTVIGSVLDVFKYLRTFEQRLGRDAAPVETNSAQRFALHDGYFHTQLRSPDSRYITARAAAHHDQIKIHIVRIFRLKMDLFWQKTAQR